jgi:hypothetical protein
MRLKRCIRVVVWLLMLPITVEVIVLFHFLDWVFEMERCPYWQWYCELLSPCHRNGQ